MEKLLVMDVAKVTLEDLETGKIISTGTTMMSNLSSTLTENFIRAGWGGGVVATINSEKNVELSFSDAFWSMEYLSIVQGIDVNEAGTGTVTKTFDAVLVANASALEATVPAGVDATSAIFVDKDGSQNPVTVVTGKIVIPELSEAVAGDTVTFIYKEEVTGQMITIDAQNFPKFFKIQYHTRAFDPSTNKVVKDIYIQFDKVKPSGNFDMNLAVSEAVSPELKFTAMNKSDNSTEMGRLFAIDRV